VAAAAAGYYCLLSQSSQSICHKVGNEGALKNVGAAGLTTQKRETAGLTAVTKSQEKVLKQL